MDHKLWYKTHFTLKVAVGSSYNTGTLGLLLLVLQQLLA